MKKVVFVTGATGGIGEATVRLFAEKGYSIALGYYKNEKKAVEMVEELEKKGVFAAAFGGDLSDYDTVKRIFEEIKRTFGSLDVLVNNAGISQIGLFLDLTREDWEKIMGVNLSSALYCSKFALPLLLSSSGSIVNISSIWGLSGGSMEVAYSVTKAGLVGFTKALAKEMTDIRVNCLCPDITDTPMNDHLSQEEKEDYAKDTLKGRILTPQEVAIAIYDIAESEKSGETIRI